LQRKQYCIFNKQYSREEYEQLVPRIIEQMKKAGEWGLYLPPSLSPFGYNESLAHEYLPLTEEQARAQGFYWRHIDEKKPVVSKTIPAARLPDRIEDVQDEVLQWAILCEKTQRPFRIQKQELDFYCQQHLPLPHLHPDERYDRRLSLRNPRKLWGRKCSKCRKEMQSTYAPDRPAVRGSEEPSGSRGEIVYCEECYLKEVY
ncbi:MAG: hypothetical protein PHI23_02460, partial [Candidatus Peribacteraceae bacterium]|nr:hypothetical protein [Candidatus Peribacteraceae bacterium]